MGKMKTYVQHLAVIVISLLILGGCDNLLEPPKENSIFPATGKSPLPGIEGTNYKKVESPKGTGLAQQKTAVQWEKLAPILQKVQQETGNRYVGFYSVSDSSNGIYYYATSPLSFSPEALQQADGETTQYFLEHRSTKDAPTQLLAAYIPNSTLAKNEMNHWILSTFGGKVNRYNQNAVSYNKSEDYLADGAIEMCWQVYKANGKTYLKIYPCIIVQGGGPPPDPPSPEPPDPRGGDSGYEDDFGPDVPCEQQPLQTDECEARHCTPPFRCGKGAPGPNPCMSDDPPDYCSDPCNISTNELKNVFSGASNTVVNKLLEMIGEYGKEFGIDTEAELQHFLAQAGKETGGFETLNVTESLYYETASLLVKNYPSKFSQTDPDKADPDDYLHNPKKVAKLAYCCKYGNGSEASGDGWRYRGRGIFQLTWKANYEAFTNFYQNHFNSTINFVQDPQLIKNDSDLAILSGMWYFKTRVIDAGITINDTDQSIKDITRAVRGVDWDWEDRKEIYYEARSKINCDN